MGKTPNAVKSPAQRLSRLEARHEQLSVIIERAQRRFEKHDKGARRAIKDLAQHERSRRRLDKAIAKAKAEAADDLINPGIVEIPADQFDKPFEVPDKTFDTTPPKEVLETVTKAIDDGPDVPAILDRTRKLQAMAAPKSKEKRDERRVVEKEKLQRELTGKRRKMPPTGKAALDAIKSKPV